MLGVFRWVNKQPHRPPQYFFRAEGQARESAINLMSLIWLDKRCELRFTDCEVDGQTSTPSH